MLAFRVQELFFDRTAVTGAVDRATRSVLSRFGAYVRRTVVLRSPAITPLNG